LYFSNNAASSAELLAEIRILDSAHSLEKSFKKNFQKEGGAPIKFGRIN